ncbi:hypothetical protein [Comamonas thiooxydans]|uniref:hypothetical protein n=1 Tax=Comamonas thiooxydans TaxID=363952 RepID=UPI000B41B88F|nr:hypothetical protein [Comamonas thiooxydans]
MADTQTEKSKNTPTEKMLNAANAAAARHGVALPDGLAQSFDICKTFLDEYLNKPTPKALKFADSIATAKGILVPEDAKKSGRDLSAWIDQHK